MSLRLSLLSWLRLTPTPRVVFFGSHPVLEAFASEFPNHVTVETRFDSSFDGVPLVNSVVARAEAETGTDLVMLVEPGVVLFNDIMSTAEYVERRLRFRSGGWAMLGTGTLLRSFPYDLDGLPVEIQPGNMQEPIGLNEASVVRFVMKRGVIDTTARGVPFILWNTRRRHRSRLRLKLKPIPLSRGPLVPFLYNRGHHPQWLVQSIARSDGSQLTTGRISIDTSNTVLAVRVDPAYVALVLASSSRPSETMDDEPSLPSPPPVKLWHQVINNVLAQDLPPFMFMSAGSALFASHELMACLDLKGGLTRCLVRRIRPGNCTCALAPLTRRSAEEEQRFQPYISCGVPVPKEVGPKINIPVLASELRHPREGLPHTLDELLRMVADEDKTVVLVSSGFTRAEETLSFVCM